jgi:hypothetical protein
MPELCWQSLSGRVDQVMETKSPDVESAVLELVEVTKLVADKIDQGAEQEEQSASNFAKQIIDTYKGLHDAESKLSIKNSKSLGMEAKATRIAVERILKLGSSPRTFWVGLGHLDGKAMTQLKKVLVSCGICKTGTKANPATTTQKQTLRNQGVQAANVALHAANVDLHSPTVTSGGPVASAGGGTGTGGPVGGGGGNWLGKAGNALTVAAQVMVVAANKLSKAFEVDIWHGIWDGILVDSNRFIENMRQIVSRLKATGT